MMQVQQKESPDTKSREDKKVKLLEAIKDGVAMRVTAGVYHPLVLEGSSLE